MANIDLTVGGTIGASEQSARKHLLFANSIDCSVNNLDIADVGQVLNVPAGFFMKNFGIRIDLAGTATATLTAGDGADVNGWIDTAFAADGAVDTWAVGLDSDAYGALGGKYYSSADTIDMIGAVANLVLGQYTVWAEGFVLQDTYALS